MESLQRKEAGMSLLPVVETFYSLQGEGCHSGWPAYFIRLAGCRNACPFCDTKESWQEEGFPLMRIEELKAAALASGVKTCVVTGGEPMLHDLDAFCRVFREAGFALWLETSGSEPLSGQWDWICLSPKRGVPVWPEYYPSAHELKVVVSEESDFGFAEEEAGKAGPQCVCLLQPEWGVSGSFLPRVTEYILAHPRWRLSLQTHKFMGIR